MENPDSLQQLIDENKRILSDPRLAEILTKNQYFWRNFIFKSLPQGPNSGLDADTVDGLHAADFLQKIAMMQRVGVATGSGGSGTSKHTELTDKEVAGVIDHADASITMAKLVTDVQNLINGALPKSGGTMTGTINSRSLIPTADISYDLGSDTNRFRFGYLATLWASTAHLNLLLPFSTSSSIGDSETQWGDIWANGNIHVNGTVDGVDVSSHAGNADAHHASGNIKDYALGLKTGIKAGTNITITDVGGYANIAASGGGAFAGSNAFLGFLNDDREIPTTEKTMISASLVLPSAATVDILVSCIAYTEDSSPSTPQVRLYINGTQVIYFWMEWFPNPDHVYKGFIVIPWVVALSAGTHTIELRTQNGVAQNTYMESQILKITVVDRSTALGSCTYTYAGS